MAAARAEHDRKRVRAIAATSEHKYKFGTDGGLDAMDTLFQILALKLRERERGAT